MVKTTEGGMIMKKCITNCLLIVLLTCVAVMPAKASLETALPDEITYAYAEYPLERAGISLHLDRVCVEGTEPDRNILLIHGVTYSSHEFDIDYEDYSLVRFLARGGYAVWRLDIAGFGQSEEVEDGFLPDSDYAAEDIHAAVETICQVSGQEKIDLLGWSWGTVTAGRCASRYPEHIGKLVLYAPILSGIGAYEVTEPFHHNTWEHAADDFQRKEDGTFDYEIVDPAVLEMLCSSSWHHDRESSPNGGRRDICVEKSQALIDLEKITAPTLVICGSRDPYLNYDRVLTVLDSLPEGSALEVIDGASHVAYLEKPCHRDFQQRLLSFLDGNATKGVITAKGADRFFEQGSKASMNGVSVVSLRGTWREMGRQYGMLMKDELEEVYLFVETIIDYSIGNANKAESIIATQTAQTPYRICEFFEGAAETSGLTVKQLQAVNAVERIGGLPRCSAAFCWGDYASGPLVIGRNYDYSEAFALLKDDVAVTVYHPADGSLATATIGYVGEIYAVNAINEKGIFLELNNGKPSANIKSPDTRITGTTALFSEMFEADELDDWELFFNTTNCSSSYIINLADSSRARSYEWCPIGVMQGGADLPEGLLVSTNYYVNSDWQFSVPSDAASWEGITRRKNLIALCEAAKGQIDAQTMMGIIETPIEEGGAQNALTVYQMVAVPETRMVWLRVIGGTDWIQINLSGFLQ
ncbi:MAG: alpha/beta hydrolase [Clostridia bacterium]|nr:alpha/beta hydrolase [Clostridia bacterium]